MCNPGDQRKRGEGIRNPVEDIWNDRDKKARQNLNEKADLNLVLINTFALRA